MASEFDTIDELRASLVERVQQQATFGQGAAAREKLIDALLERVEIPVPAQLVEDEVHQHLDGEGRLEDDEHRAEVTEASERRFRIQVLLDKIVEQHDVQVSQDELTQFLIQTSAQYGMAPQEFVDMLQQTGQLQVMVGEVARNKALSIVLSKVTVVDTDGKAVDLSGFAAVEDEEEAVEVEAPAEKPARKPAAKKAAAEESAEVAEEVPAKKPARKPAAKKPAADADAAAE